MPRSSDYSQLGIGNCGHVVHTWPQICELGGRNPQVICEDCTRERCGLPDYDGLTVWVPLRVPEKPKTDTPEAKPKAKKAKPLKGMALLLQQEGLL